MPKKQIALLLVFVFVDVLGYSLFFPILPYYAELFGAGPTLVGLMIASNAAAQFIASPVIGHWSDRLGRRPLLIFSTTGTLISFILLGLAEPIGIALTRLISGMTSNVNPISAEGIAVIVLFLCRIFDGIAGGNVALARAYVSDVTDETNRAKGLGFIGAAFGLGFVFGPAIGGTLANWSDAVTLVNAAGLARFAVPAFATVLIVFLDLVGIIFWLPESLPPDKRANSKRQSARVFPNGLQVIFQQSRMSTLLIIRFLFSLALVLFMANFAILTQHYLRLSDQATSYLITYAGILLILVQVVGIGWLVRRFEETRLVLIGLGVITLALFGLAFAQNAIILVFVLTPLALAGGVLNTLINSLISKAASEHQVGRALGLATSAESFTWIVAPVLGGFLIGQVGGWSLGIVGGIIAGLLAIFTWQRLIKPAHRLDAQK